MSDQLENARAQKESLESATKSTLSSAERARLWAGLNRYLAAEAEHAHHEAAAEKDQGSEH